MALAVKNFMKWQQFTTRRPTWIKLHHSLIDKMNFWRLPLETRALLPMIWLLASEYQQGIISDTDAEIAYRFRITTEELQKALRPAIKAGMILEGADANKLSVKVADADRKRANRKKRKNGQIDMLSVGNQTEIRDIEKKPLLEIERERESEKEREKNTRAFAPDLGDLGAMPATTSPGGVAERVNGHDRPKPAVDIQDAISYYNARAKTSNWQNCNGATAKRKSTLQRRIKELGGLDEWKARVDRAAKSSFLCGRTHRSDEHKNWKPSFDYFLREEPLMKIAEGGFDDPPGKKEKRSAWETVF